MFKRVLLSAVGLAAAVGGPIAYFSAWDYWKAIRTAIAAPTRAETDLPSSDHPAAAAEPGAAPHAARKAPIEGAPVSDLAEVVRFDVTPEWVRQRWPQVSIGLANLQLNGHRVTLVTGAKPSDLAGALTYYFNTRRQVERITFRGTTGDPSGLVRLLTTRYKFVQRATNDPNVVLYETIGPDRKQTGVARIRSAWVVRSATPNQNFEVEFLVQRPAS